LVAKRAGVTLNAVRHYRLSRGIAPSSPPTANQKTTPSVAGVDYAWLVSFAVDGGHIERVLQGRNLIQAAAKAVALGLGDVHSVIRVGEMVEG
jgi:hypothetical protein